MTHWVPLFSSYVTAILRQNPGQVWMAADGCNLYTMLALLQPSPLTSDKSWGLQGKPKYPVSTHQGWVLPLQVTRKHARTHVHVRTLRCKRQIVIQMGHAQSKATCKMISPHGSSHIYGMETDTRWWHCYVTDRATVTQMETIKYYSHYGVLDPL